MNRSSFDVLEQPWIPVIRRDGSREELGILPCLEHAHELREIRDPSPTEEFGLYRLLITFVLDALVLADRRPEHPLDLGALIDEGHFDAQMLRHYVAQCGDVFDLFHPERPFLQSAGATGEQKSVFDFYPVFPSGANVVHFSHQTSGDQIETPAGIARLLV
jgi:CRISPR system Cascade subunit CasA